MTTTFIDSTSTSTDMIIMDMDMVDMDMVNMDMWAEWMNEYE